MFVVDLAQWWYFRGWGVFAKNLRTKLSDMADFFSIGDLLRTLFKPYRQIGASAAAEPGQSQMSVFFDKLISRLVGMVTRLFLIVFGGLAILAQALIGGIMLILWPAVPLALVASIILTVMGVTV